MPEPGTSPLHPSAPRRHFKNAGGYRGETIDLDSTLERILSSAERAGWIRNLFSENPSPGLWSLTKVGHEDEGARSLYISTGIHGDEPAGPLAAEQLVNWNGWPPDIRVYLCPCLNPSGMRANKRENSGGIDLNRQYLHLQAAEVRAHISWIDQLPRLEAAICLHEDWESNGFYVYELARPGTRACGREVLESAAQVCPIDLADEIEGRPANNGLIVPSSDPLVRQEWPEAFYLFQKKTDLCYTFEAPSDFELSVRSTALAEAVKRAVKEIFGA